MPPAHAPSHSHSHSHASSSGGRPSRIPPAHQHSHVLHQQKLYASHLGSQLDSLSNHPGTYGELAFGIQATQESVGEVQREIERAQLSLSKRNKMMMMSMAEKQQVAAAPPSDDMSASPSAGSDKENENSSSAAASNTPAPQPLPTAPDLDALASSLEHLASCISMQSHRAESQSVSLRQEISRVMEVYEDPLAFLPPPLPGQPDFGGYLSSSSAQHGGTSANNSKGRKSSVKHADGPHAHLPPSELLQQAYGPQALHSPLASASAAGVEPPQPLIYNHLSPFSGFDYGSMASFLRGVVRARVNEEVDGDDGVKTGGSGGSSAAAGFDPSLHDPSDPLTSLRQTLARKFATLERDPVLLASKENVRRTVAAEASKPQGPGNVLSTRLAGEGGGGKKSRRGSHTEESAAAPPIGAGAKPRARRTDLNPELYPAFAELSAIFGPNPSAVPGAASQRMFGGLATAIPSYIAYQDYLVSQHAQAEASRAAAEAAKAAEEQREILASARREAKEARERKQREQEEELAQAQAVARAQAQAQAAALAATATNAAALAVPPLPIHQVTSAENPAQTTARGLQSHREPQGYNGRVDASTDTRPPLHPSSSFDDLVQAPHPMSAAYFPGGGRTLPRFDAVWEVLPQARDVAVQAETARLSASSSQQQVDAGTIMTPRPGTAVPRSRAPSMPSSPLSRPHTTIAPRATAQFGAHYPAQQLQELQAQEVATRRATGAQASGSAPAATKPHPLSVLEQAALEVEPQGRRVRGEGLSSTRALDNLMQTAGQQHSQSEGIVRVVTRDEPPSSISSELSVPPHPLFSATPSTTSPILAACPNSGLLNMVLQLYDMPSERQVDAEWKRVLSEEEEREARARIERGEAPSADSSVLQDNKEESEEVMARIPERSEDEEQLRRDAEAAEVRVAQSAAAERGAAAAADHKKVVSPIPAASSAESKQAAELRQRLEEEASERARLVAEAARLARELEEVKATQAAQAAQQAQQMMIQQAVQAAVQPLQQQQQQQQAAALSDPNAITPSERDAEQRRVWELEARARWTAEQEAKKAQEAATAAAEARHAEQIAQLEAVRQALAAEAESIRAAAAERKALEAAAIAPALAAEIDKIRATQAAERALMDSLREEERARQAAEEARRTQERQRQLAAQAEEEAAYAARKAEREAEDERRRELERKRDELLASRLAAEAQKTQQELAKLREDLERMRAQPAVVEVPAPAPAICRRPIHVSQSFGGSDSSSDFDLHDPSRFPQPKLDLSEGEIDLGFLQARGLANVSPGQIGPTAGGAHATQERPQQRVQMPARRTGAAASTAGDRQTAAVLHPPIPSVTPARPGAHRSRLTVAEEKYPTHHSSTRDEILDLLNASKLAPEDADPVQSASALPLATQFNVAYTSSIAAARRALAAPSRQVLVGPSSPPLTDISDVSSPRRGGVDESNSSVSTPSPLPRRSHHHHAHAAHRSRSPVSSSKKALRLLKQKYSLLKARQIALEDETSSFSLEDSQDTVEEQIARAKRRSKFGAAAAVGKHSQPARKTAAAAQAEDDEQFMPSVEVHAQARRTARNVDAAVESAAAQLTPPAPAATTNTTDSITTLPSAIHPPLDSAAQHAHSALSPLKHRPTRSSSAAPTMHNNNNATPLPPASAGQPKEEEVEEQIETHPAVESGGSASNTLKPSTSPSDDSYNDEFDIPHEDEYLAPQAQPSVTASETAPPAPSFLTAVVSPPSSSPPSPASAAFAPAAAAVGTSTANARPSSTASAASSSSTTAPASRPVSAIATGPSSSSSSSIHRNEPPSPSSRMGGKSLLLASAALPGRSSKLTQAQMVAQHRAKLQAAKLAALQSSAAAAEAAANAPAAEERPATAASTSSDPFASFAHGGRGSRPTSSSSLTGGGNFGLFGLDAARAREEQQRPTTRAGGPRPSSPGLVDSTEEHDLDQQSFNSPESKAAFSTEQWIKSLRDQ